MNKSDLKKAAGVSWGAVTKMSKDEKVSMDILIKVCTALNCNVGDIMDILPEQDITEQ
jgi:DNA-binding Xre family transcriptional regulator